MERSSVFIVIDMKDNDKLLKSARDWDKKYNLDRHHAVENLIGEADKDVITEDDKYRIIIWRGIKWYAKISDDKCFKNQEFFESLNDYGIKCDFVRIGEETKKLAAMTLKKTLDLELYIISSIICPCQ